MRKGYWIILDELNLAPTDVLEALNRLLDDNRELFVAETQEVIKAHPRFMLFATQNPPGLYGGRKVYHSFSLREFFWQHGDSVGWWMGISDVLGGYNHSLFPVGTLSIAHL